MPRHLRLLRRLVTASLAAAVLATSVFAAPTRPESDSPYKRLQVQQLRRKPMKKLERLRQRPRATRERQRELRALAREMRRRGKDQIVTRGNRGRRSDPEESALPARRAAPANAVPVASRAAAALAPNVRLNDPSGDFANDGQCETSIASWNDYMVAAWNDGTGFSDASNETQGWATSTDGGQTWTDQGKLPPPVQPADWKWSSDPVVVVNPNTGAFYYAGLADAEAGSLSALGVLKGRFSGGVFTWTDRAAARSENNSQYFLDKEWLAVDPASGRVHLSYTNFTNGLDRIEIQSADSSLASWTSPLKISTSGEEGYVQASRVVVGTGGTVLVAYWAIGTEAPYWDFVRFCRSTNGGASFSTPTDAVSFFSNWGTGAPGFNRDYPIPNFPALAVDRSTGPHAGRIYLSWAECLNWYDDALSAGNSGAKSEVEPNGTGAGATPFTPGMTLRGALSSTADVDLFRVTLQAGQTLFVEADSSTIFQLSLRALAVDGATRLAWTTGVVTDIQAGLIPSWIWTAPAGGDYFVSVASVAGSGAYRLRTALATRDMERGADQRDVFVAHSDNGGASWSAPVRVDDAPVGYDGWLPEVAVGPDGHVYCAWYDWRDAPAATSGGESSISLARSTDGGDTWTRLGAVSDTLSDWTACRSNIAPNQGDYMSLHASATTLAVCWSDARGGTPDAYMASLPLGSSSATVTLVSATAVPGRVDLDWAVRPPDGFRAALQRSVAGAGAWTVLDSLDANAEGHVTYADTTVVLGTAYDYRLGVIENGTEYFRGQVTVLVPSGLGLALRGVHPNPTDGSNASLSFTLPLAGDATVEVFDLSGRLVDSRRLTGQAAASHVIPFALWPSARSGVYLVRITQRGRSLTSRVSIVR